MARAGLPRSIFKAVDVDATDVLDLVQAVVAFQAFAAGETDTNVIRSQAIASSRTRPTAAGDDGADSSSLGSVLHTLQTIRRFKRWRRFAVLQHYSSAVQCCTNALRPDASASLLH